MKEIPAPDRDPDLGNEEWAKMYQFISVEGNHLSVEIDGAPSSSLIGCDPDMKDRNAGMLLTG